MIQLNKTQAQAVLNRMLNNWFMVDGQRQKVTNVSIAPHTNRVMIMSNLTTNFETLERLPTLLLRYQAVDTDLAAYMQAALGTKTEPGPYHPHIAARIRQIRLRRGIKQCAVAAALGCTQQNYSILECDAKNPLLSTLLQLCAVLDVELWYLLSPMPVTDETLQNHKHFFAMGQVSSTIRQEELQKLKQALQSVAVCAPASIATT